MSSADTINPAQLLAAAERLTAEELVAFATEVVALRARRLAPSLATNEAALLQRMNASVPAGEAQRYAELVALRDAESLMWGSMKDEGPAFMMIVAPLVCRLPAMSFFSWTWSTICCVRRIRVAISTRGGSATSP